MAIQVGEVLIINERDGVITRQVSSQIARTGGQGGESALHLNCRCAAADHAERDGSVMAAKTKTRRTVRLTDSGFQRGTAVNDVLETEDMLWLHNGVWPVVRWTVWQKRQASVSVFAFTAPGPVTERLCLELMMLAAGARAGINPTKRASHRSTSIFMYWNLFIAGQRI